MSTGADTKANPIWDGGALQLLEHTVPLDAARDNDGGGNVKLLAREVDLLCRLCALELVDLKRVPVHTAGGEACGECQRALTGKQTLGVVAHLSWEILVSLRTAASAEAPSAPMWL